MQGSSMNFEPYNAKQRAWIQNTYSSVNMSCVNLSKPLNCRLNEIRTVPHGWTMGPAGATAE